MYLNENRFEFHKGMLWLQDVEDFKWIYIHTGNNEDHTDGCILVGTGCNIGTKQSVIGSVNAYIGIYTKIADAVLDGETVSVRVL